LSRTLNLGVLAHVDAGKTTLTERLLHAAGVISEIGNVDKGTTHTDWLPLEKERGITIKSAVASFTLDGIAVNLIDTPGHPDFIAEVERTLGVLDGVVLVVSAVEGVQPQTRLLMRVLQRLRLPTVLFVNKIDRREANPGAALDSIRRRLTDSAIPLGRVDAPGSPGATFLPFGPQERGFVDDLAVEIGQHEPDMLAALEDNGAIAYATVRRALVRQTKAARVHPVVFGSALSGAGIPFLTKAITELLPSSIPDPSASLSGSVFKIERGPKGERLAYLRIASGTVQRRQEVVFARGVKEKVSAIYAFEDGALVERPVLEAGQIGKVAGLKAAKIGDRFGDSAPNRTPAQFARPSLATRVAARDAGDGPRLFAALTDLSEQDPLIAMRHDPRSGELSLSLYGEVQREVVQATLEREYGVAATFDAVRPLYVERPTGRGEAVEVMHGPGNPFDATVGFRVEPGPPGSGLRFRLAVEASTIPLFLFKTIESFATHVESWVFATLLEGLYGWEVTDCAVTMHRCLYGVADGPPSRRGNSSAADFRHVTPVALMRALRAAGTVVCEPLATAELELPSPAVPPVLAALGRLGASIECVTARGALTLVRAQLTSESEVQLRRALPELTGGEGVAESSIEGYRPLTGRPPRRHRSSVDPLDRQAYLASLGRHLRVEP
jgi:ribosomal protection tetracycline resistance protein